MILDKRLIFVTGKGGVGKSTVAIALGILGARHGRRTIVAELASQERVQRAFGHSAAQFHETELMSGLFTISIDPQRAMDEYLRIKTGPIGHAIGTTKLFQAFAMATPGMRELLTMGKVWELAQFERQTEGAVPYDLVIVDAPATGHSVGFLHAPQTFAEIARVGPIARQAGKIAATLADRSFTGLVAVTTPEEMPINETLMLKQSLEQEQIPIDAVVVNALYPSRFLDGQPAALQAALERASDPVWRGALRAALSEHVRAQRQREQTQRLQQDLGVDPIELPYLFTEQVGRPELERLTDVLELGLATRKDDQ